jgi:SpoVK/Ycf46/Vps4 family AAA+-type ATPase
MISNQRALVFIIDDFEELFETGGRLMSAFMNDLFFFRKTLNLPYLCLIGISSKESMIPVINKEVLFKNVVNLDLGDYNGRLQWLKLLLHDELPNIAQKTKGYSPADLKNLVAQALIDNEDNIVTEKSLELALETVKPANLSGSVFYVLFCNLATKD